MGAAALVAAPALASAAFGAQGQPRLKQLIGKQAEEIRNPIKVVEHEPTATPEDGANPRFGIPAPES